MTYLFLIISVSQPLLWLLVVRPYCIRNGRGYTPGATMRITFWVDWQEAREIAGEKGDRGLMNVCRAIFWLHMLQAVVLVTGMVLAARSAE